MKKFPIILTLTNIGRLKADLQSDIEIDEWLDADNEDDPPALSSIDAHYTDVRQLTQWRYSVGDKPNKVWQSE